MMITAAHARHTAASHRPTKLPRHWGLSDAAWNWLLTLLVGLVAAVLRLFRLDQPRAVVFDETYYVKDAWAMLNTGVERDWPSKLAVGNKLVPINELFASGDTDHWLQSAEYVVHPPMGKWFIAWGLKLFGGAANPAAWRASVAIAGIIGVILLTRLTLRLFHNTSVAVLAGLLMAVDGVGIVMARTGLLDNFIMVLALAAFLLLVIHRDHARAKLEQAYALDAADPDASWMPAWQSRKQRKAGVQPRMVLNAAGPVVAFSWARVGAVVLLGLATGVKWSGTYLFAVFCVISVCWDAWNRREVGYRPWFRFGMLRDGIISALYMVPLYGLTYLLDWITWFTHSDSYMHDWALSHPGEGWQWLPPTLRSFVAYHQQMWDFHTHLDAPHDYKANPLTWPLQIRPTSFYWEKPSGHPGLCALAPNSQCVEAITSLGNPLIWWVGSLCTVLAIGIAIVKHGDWRIWAVLAGFLGGWLPWVQYLNRTTFTFYSIVLLPWIVLAIAYVANELRLCCSRSTWLVAWWAVVIVATLVSAFFYPIWTAMPVPYEFWRAHMWLNSWI
ncbi:dolichyl-phosphate-mannose--protein mannosyltransferase [Bifidobacterium gallicum]|uniref:Polyprenol-phosphate-mannose--protein mannosyltransferase n=1 Tax=Bifidobacterium gallicum DSM 20093 = LMG 11596 TaxID=561180 RepID=D1NVQ0_9BIFI|nr:glycosyltransferase family 39 protein [Bifidobacterium gallicum]EFA22901.1 putative dolichyl-phosphate-mannose-protein mannosyltransferase [Bifidobacterium gallicum DSM 20093 = LMG 11596]KFI59399.1 glycosyl transferase [Bifidobacterium gallicum DSM 20093 = LMG 11596]